MQILMILTSHDRLGPSGHPTGFWLEEFAAPYYVFRDAGATVTLASVAGGQPPVDPRSEEDEAQTPATRRFQADPEARAALAATLPLAELSVEDYDAVFYPGGHGPLWDLADDADSIALIEGFAATGKPVAAICHGPAVLRHARAPGGAPLVEERRVTGFTNEEEEAVGLTDVVPFLLEDELKAAGARFEHGPAFQPFVVRDGKLVTGQNPASSAPAAHALLDVLRGR